MLRAVPMPRYDFSRSGRACVDLSLPGSIAATQPESVCQQGRRRRAFTYCVYTRDVRLVVRLREGWREGQVGQRTVRRGRGSFTVLAHEATQGGRADLFDAPLRGGVLSGALWHCLLASVARVLLWS